MEEDVLMVLDHINVYVKQDLKDKNVKEILMNVKKNLVKMLVIAKINQMDIYVDVKKVSLVLIAKQTLMIVFLTGVYMEHVMI